MKNIDKIRNGEPFNIVSTTDLMHLALKLIPEERCRLKDANYSEEYINGMTFGMAQLAIRASIDKDILMTVDIKKEHSTPKEPEAPTESHECQCEKTIKDGIEAFRKKVLDMLDFKLKALRNTSFIVKTTSRRVYQESGASIDAKTKLLKELKSSIEKL